MSLGCKVSRQFTLIDALVLMAALAIAFYPIRDYLDFIDSRHTVLSLGPVWTFVSIWRAGTLLSGMLAPLGVSLSLALWPLYGLWIIRLPWNGEVVAIAWLILWLSGSWRPEATWIDRAGQALGIYWIISGMFFDYLQRF
jgi:hypothetical protein